MVTGSVMSGTAELGEMVAIPSPAVPRMLKLIAPGVALLSWMAALSEQNDPRTLHWPSPGFESAPSLFTLTVKVVEASAGFACTTNKLAATATIATGAFA
jgi:hypothetical protein